jgi:hypothetical protein
LRAAVGLVSCPLSHCDVNNDGSVTAGDALRTLQYSVGFDIPLVCGAPALTSAPTPTSTSTTLP